MRLVSGSRLTKSARRPVLKSGIVDNILSWAKFKLDKDLKKTDKGKRKRCVGLLQLVLDSLD